MKIQTTRIYSEIQSAVDKGYTTISLQGSSRSSKTYNTMIWLIVHALQHAGTGISVVRATLPAIKGSVYRDFKEIMVNMGIWDAKRMNKSEFIYSFANGSWMEFFSTSDEQKLRGRKRTILYVNEANELLFIEWQQLKMRTTKLAIVDYNPSFSDEHWLCELNRDKRTYHFISTYKDNPFLEQTIIDEIESLQWKNESLWRIYGLGLQAIVEGLIFTNVDKCDHIPPYIERRYIGMDFGYENDPTAIVEVAIEGSDIWLNEVTYNTHMLTSDIIHALKQSTCKGRKVISESADPRLITEIYRAGIDIHPVHKFPDSINAGITKMLEYRLHITSQSRNISKEFGNYTWEQDKEGNWLNQPIDAFNHAIDAIRYVVMETVMGGKRRTMSVRKLRSKIGR